MLPAKWKRLIKQSVYKKKTMIVVHTSCFDESTELQEMLKIFEQKQDLTHLHLQHLKDDEDWDEALDLIIKADRIISI